MVYNPAAGAGRGRVAWEQVRPALEALGAEVEAFPTRGPRDGIEQGQRAAERHPVVAVYGGDGSNNEVFNGVVASGKKPTVLLLPGGTMNVLARDLKIPLNPFAAAGLLEQGTARPVYLGKANGRYFSMMTSTGLDAAIVHGMDVRPTLKRALGPLAFVWEGLRQVARYRFPEIRVAADGREYKGHQVVVGNSCGYGGFFYVTAKADVFRPGFEVAICTERKILRHFYYLVLAMGAKLELSRDHVFFKTTRVEISSAQPVPVQMDGEPFGTLPVEVVMDGTTMNIFCPAVK